ncbi:polysaccharide export outer membrane protein [Geothermobacter ehrlichii]|uniref:Polysaccharide export outer membrane protein n=1 Tax=Geothermobacter ehrlichii TaxID=213224 RepID=A0A5D3WJX0_9BACT|nr:SLBB domain-containing protein [Geothermobacter ehrlichii]TYO98337.1 polysaccharide export outer membrane protein [Geothermobacter ehrlichii]
MMKKVVVLALAAVLCLDLAVVAAAEKDYRVGDGDVLEVTVYDHPDLATTVRVGGDGSIIFPLIGQLDIGGLTVNQVAAKLAAALGDGYIINPQVSVFVKEFRSSKVVIVGQVERPGLYELTGSTTLLELISKAGGLARDAGDTATVHRRLEGGNEKVIQVDLERLFETGDSRLDIPLQNGDNVFILKAGMIYVTGEVRSPDSYRVEPGMTVLKAITEAGGFTNLAARGRVKLIRKTDGKEKIFDRVPMNMVVKPEDVVVVPESFF